MDKKINMRNNKSIYVPDKYLDFWEKLKKDAETCKPKKKAVGEYMCSRLKKLEALEGKVK
jgi:hypothetical protein